MYDVQLFTYVVHARYIPVTSDLRMRNRHIEVTSLLTHKEYGAHQSLGNSHVLLRYPVNY